MYTPASNRVDGDAELRRMVAATGAAELISTGRDGCPQATLLPILWSGDVVCAHMARANPHWRELEDGAPALLVCAGAQAYVSPAWYPSKAEHGKVVPTWNYSSVHLRGTLRLQHDTVWLARHVTELTDRHEEGRARRWRVTDAPAAFIAAQLRGIVGIEIRVERVEGKAKLGQNRPVDDRLGVIDGLSREPGPGSAAVVAAMRTQLGESRTGPCP